MSKRKVELVRPVVNRREQIAYEVVSQQRGPEPGKMLDDYIDECARYVAKRVLMTIANRIDDARDLCCSEKNYRLVLNVYSHEEQGEREVTLIRWKHPIYRELNGEINIADVYGYRFAHGVVYFYYEWFEALIEAFNEMLDYSGEQDDEDEGHYKWYIKV